MTQSNTISTTSNANAGVTVLLLLHQIPKHNESYGSFFLKGNC